MTPQEKSIALVQSFIDGGFLPPAARIASLIAVDEIIPIVEGYEDALSASQKSDELTYWEEVKQEIERL